MKLYFKPKITIICLVLILGMLRASYWQWQRHLQKIQYIDLMDQRLRSEVSKFPDIIPKQNPYDATSWNDLTRRRVFVTGEYDFEHEMVLRNRRYDGAAGVYSLTPLKITNTDFYVVVNRGFIPLSRSEKESRKEFQKAQSVSFTGLIKESASKTSFLSPSDPPAGGVNPWVDAWLRVDLPNISKQLPYKLLPIQLEIMSTSNIDAAKVDIIKSSEGREELLVMGLKGEQPTKPDFDPKLNYPVAVFDAVIPPGRHLGYVYEWALMAVVTLLIGIVLQLRPGRKVA